MIEESCIENIVTLYDSHERVRYLVLDRAFSGSVVVEIQFPDGLAKLLKDAFHSQTRVTKIVWHWELSYLSDFSILAANLNSSHKTLDKVCRLQT